MDPAPHSEATWLRGLSAEDRVRFLARLAHNLTISGRAVFMSETSADARLEQLRYLNEIQHRVLGYLGHALGSDEDVGWLPNVASWVLEPPDAELRKAALRAWTYTRDSFADAVP
jgi:hypothetical protein